MVYITGYFDYNLDAIKTNDQIFIDIDDAKYDLNYVILVMINEYFGIYLNPDYLFVLNSKSESSEKIVKIDDDTDLIIKKSNEASKYTIDIWMTGKNYIFLKYFTHDIKTHLYKFFILVK
jgi:hypothetical protein